MKGSDIMGKNYFTNEQVEFLRKNKYVKHVSNKGITYSLEFKELFIKEYGLKNPAKIFEDAGLPISIVGQQRINNCSKRWRKQYKNTGELKDTRKESSGRPLKRELSDKEKLERAEARIKLLEAENELLKKNELIEMRFLTDIKSISNLK